ncbi:MAG: PSD1 domain-containing protein [Pirellulales bacterium]|nr:PSD1 domain-containing protein [Pirellulales bacterium]
MRISCGPLRDDFAVALALIVMLLAVVGVDSAIAAEAATIDRSLLPAPADREVDFVKDIRPIFAAACFQCHGPESQEAGLRLDVRKRAMAGADSGPVIVAGKSVDSRLIHLVAGLDKDAGPMPPEDEGEALTKDQIALLRTWIDRGAKWPDEVAGEESKKSDHWSFQPIVRAEPPKFAGSGQQAAGGGAFDPASWARNPIDGFILAGLQREGVLPSPEADRITLLRRVYLDLIGLPPTPTEVAAFLADQSSNAYERVVDRLLESPHYGERWGRHWLDAARYADSDGYEKDLGRPFAWRYRDWVINAINADMPFTAFTVQQIAGDLLTKGDPEYDAAALVATGFQRNTLLNKEGGVDPEEDRVKRTIDRTNTVGTVWLGLSVGCANCHTHKYDPITQQEYFQFYAFFNNIEEVDATITPDAMAMLELPDLTPREILPGDRDGAVDEKPQPASPATESKAEVRPKPNAKERSEKARHDDGSLTLAQTVAESGKRRETYIHLRGDFLSKGAVVEPTTLEVLPPCKPRGSEPDRLDLARWLVSGENPLTARVIVNRLWQTHFGRGIVATGEDFGTQGDQPSNAELLDWLASEFQACGWRVKHMHRLIATSATYRQSAAARPELLDRDPYNSWLARQNRLRVDAEIVRDLALSVGGLLNPEIGGPSIHPPQPPGVSDLTYAGAAKWKESQGPDRYRRGLYIWFQRTSPYPSLVTFDDPEANLACTRRERSNTPLQALTLLNDVVFVECAQALGKRLMAAAESSPPASVADARIREAFQLCLSREPSQHELSVLKQLYDDALKVCRDEPEAAAKILGTKNADSSTGVVSPENAACVAVARAMLNLDEFLTRE